MYDSNSPTPSISISQSPYASEHGLNNAVRRNSSSSLGISEELAFIKREVASLKDQVWNRAHNEFLPSEDCSIQNSFTEGQPDQSYNDERGLRNRGGRDSLYSSSHASGPQNQASSIAKQPVLASRSGESSAYTSELERNNPCDITLGQLELNNNVKCDKEMLYNGIIIEGTLAIEANMYTVTSVNNGLNQSQRRTTSHFNPLIMTKPEVDPTSNGLEEINLRALPLLTSTNHLSLNSSKPKFKEMVSVVDENDRKKVIFTDIASQQRITTENDEPAMLSSNNRLLDDDQGSEEAGDHRGINPLLKKTLSVIFSTNESIETTPPQSIVRRTEIQEEITPLKLLQMETHKESKYPNDSIRIERNEERTVEDSCATSRSEDKRSSKEVLITESNGTIMMTEGVSSLGSEETFMGLLCVTKLQNKSNRSLEEKLNRMADLHNKQMEKYEKTIQILNEKNEKYTKGNELLVKTLRTCEKEIDSLALNNQTLHKNLVMFEEDMSKKRVKEKQLIESNAIKQKEIEKLREDLRKKEIELEESKKSFTIDNKKVETAKVYAKSCEDSIAAIDQTLRRILSDKGGPKMSLIIINKVLESIFAETSKFVGRVERSATVPIPTIETESKSPSRKDNARCFTSIGTEDTVSTFDYRDRMTQSQSAHKQRSKTPDTHSTAMSPKGRAPRSLKTLPESPTSTKSEKKGLIQKLMTSSGNLNQKGVLNSVRRSFDHRRLSEREGGLGESSILRQAQNNGNTIFRRESVCTSSISKTPDNKKSRINMKVTPEMDRIKENLRRKVLSHVSLTPTKK